MTRTMALLAVVGCVVLGGDMTATAEPRIKRDHSEPLPGAVAPPPRREQPHTDRRAPIHHESAWNATVLVRSRCMDPAIGSLRIAVGAGIVVGHDRARGEVLVATALHLVSCAGTGRARILFPSADGSQCRATEARLERRNPRQDLAELAVTIPHGARVEVARQPHDVTWAPRLPVTAIGYLEDRSGGRHPRRRRGCEGIATKVSTSGQLMATQSEFEASIAWRPGGQPLGRLQLGRAIFHTAPLSVGLSGGPLVDPSGAVLGLNLGRLPGRQVAVGLDLAALGGLIAPE